MNQRTPILVYIEGKVVATGRFRIKNNFLKFERIAVLKDFRKIRLGSRLLKYMQKVGSEKYPRYLQITYARKDAIDFYKKNGFKQIGEGFQEANIEHYLMIHTIKDKKLIKNLKCFKDPKCDKNIHKILFSYITNF